MAYLIETFDKPGALPLRLAVRDKPLAYLEENKESLISCGAKLDDDGENAYGGLYLVDFETRTQAEDFIAADPYFQANLFREVRLIRWRKAYLDGKNFLTEGSLVCSPGPVPEATE
jgi:uncharacterized protein YciI